MRFLMPASLLLAMPAFAQQFPEAEPNDTLATAQVLPLGQQCNASLAAAESDWFTFTTPGGYHTITGSGPGTDNRFYLWDSSGTTLLAFNDDTRSLTGSLTMNLAAGTYLLQVTGYTATTTGVYTVEVSQASPAKAYTASEAEPNNSVATANPIADGAQIQGSLGFATVLSDVALAGSTTTSILATTPLVANAHVGQIVRMTSGAAAGAWGTVSANTTTALTISALPSIPLAGDTFDIETPDLDVYQLVLTAPRSMVAFQISEGDAPALFTHRYEIWDAAGALLAPTTTYGGNAGDSGTFSGRTAQQIRCLPAGTYHVVVRTRSASTNLGGAPTVAPYSRTGNYRLEVKARGMNIVGTPVTENAEPNNTVATATPIATGQQGVGNLTINTGADASDWWGPIQVTQPSLLQFQTGNGIAPAMTDTTINLRLYDPITNTLGAPSASTAGNTLEPAGSSHARGTFQFLLPGTVYYLEVLSPGTTAATQSGNYVLEISQIDANAYSVGNVANVTANATGCGTAGVPAIARTHTSTSSGEFPTIGETFAVQATNLNGVGNLGLMVSGFAPFLPAPLDLSLFGAPGCLLNVSPDLIEVLIGSPSGVADYVLTIPGNPTLKGAVLYQQPCKWDFSVNALGIQPGGWARYILGDRPY